MGKSSIIRYDPIFSRRVSIAAIDNPEFAGTNKEIAALLGCCEKTVIEWKKRHTEFAEACEAAAITADLNVECALYKAACGHYAYEETSTYKIIRDEQTGEEIQILVEKETRRRYIPPSSAAQSLWAYNRMPDKYKRKIEQATELRIVKDERADEELNALMAAAQAAEEECG